MSDIIFDAVSRLYLTREEEKYALRNINISIRKGEFMVLCGPSGSGKSTFLNLIAGLDLPTKGSVRVGDHDISKMAESDREIFRLYNVGFIFQSYNLIPVLTALENVCFVLELQGKSKKERIEKAEQILNRIGMIDLKDRLPHELSGGQQQRVAVARAIVSIPRLVLADEPTANLDTKTAEGLLNLMREFNEEFGTTFIFSTHDELVLKNANRVVHLRDGEVKDDTIV